MMITLVYSTKRFGQFALIADSRYRVNSSLDSNSLQPIAEPPVLRSESAIPTIHEQLTYGRNGTSVASTVGTLIDSKI
jgi:hypothetical protein